MASDNQIVIVGNMVNAWRENATHLAESLHKGDRVVLGRLRLRGPPAADTTSMVATVATSRQLTQR
jgi:single-stranded DNA-binding protein